MPRCDRYLATLLLLLFDKCLAQSVADHGLSDVSSLPHIIFPLPGKPTYNFWDSIKVTYWSPWTGGVNLSTNCCPGTENEGYFDEAAACLGGTPMCSPCPSNGTLEFHEIDVDDDIDITYPLQCWFALRPYEVEDVPENVSATAYVGEAMATITTGGAFTMISNTAIPPTTHALRPPPDVWTRLSPGEQTGILCGVYLTLFASLVGAGLMMRKRNRLLEDPSNPMFQGLFVVEPDGSIRYKPDDGRERNFGAMRSFHVRGVPSVDGNSSRPLLDGADLQS